MPGLLAYGLVSAGASIAGGVAGGLFGGGGGAPELPEWLQDLILQEYNSRSYEGFAPDRSTFTSSMNAEVENIMRKMGINKDAFRAESASRGIHGSGEAMGAMYSSVVAPAVGEATAATGRTMIQYEGLEQRGEIAAASLRGQNLDRLMGYQGANLSSQMAGYQMDQMGQQQFWGGVGGGVSNFMDLMMMQRFYPGLFQGGGVA